VLADNKIDSMAAAIWHHWCQPYGNPEMILSNQGKVWTSKLESRINEKNIAKGSKSASAGINYKDEPTQKPKGLK
jgi:hypothetical protein